MVADGATAARSGDNTAAGRMTVQLRCQCGGCSLGGRIALEGSGPRLGENGTRTAGSRDEWKWPRAAKIGSFLRFRLLGGVLIDRTTMTAVYDRNTTAAPAQCGVKCVEGVPGYVQQRTAERRVWGKDRRSAPWREKRGGRLESGCGEGVGRRLSQSHAPQCPSAPVT